MWLYSYDYSFICSCRVMYNVILYKSCKSLWIKASNVNVNVSKHSQSNSTFTQVQYSTVSTVISAADGLWEEGGVLRWCWQGGKKSGHFYKISSYLQLILVFNSVKNLWSDRLQDFYCWPTSQSRPSALIWSVFLALFQACHVELIKADERYRDVFPKSAGCVWVSERPWFN